MKVHHSNNVNNKNPYNTARQKISSSCCTDCKCSSSDITNKSLISNLYHRQNPQIKRHSNLKKKRKKSLVCQKHHSKPASPVEKCDNRPRGFTYSLSKVLLLLLSQVPLRALALPILQPGQHESRMTTSIHNVGENDPMSTSMLLVNIFLSAFLVILGGIFAGLTLGLMGQDEIYLKVIQQSGETERERRNASTVLALLKRGKHWVLVTLLLSNVITNESLPIVLDRCLGGGWPAILSSTVAIVIFGEIIPQSLSVRYGLGISAAFAPYVLALMYALYPLAYPIALLLDTLLGQNHGTLYKRAGLKTLVGLHKTMGVERLNEDEVTIISSVLDLKNKPVALVMTPIDDVFTMPSNCLLDEKVIEKILHSGFNRIPVHAPDNPKNFIGMLLVRTLITYDPRNAFPISSFPLATLPETRPETSCLNILNYFQEGKSHMIVVSNHPGAPEGALGVLTLEDVIEELIGEEIIDESDVYIDVHRAIKRDRIFTHASGHHLLHHALHDSSSNSKGILQLDTSGETVLLNATDRPRLNPLNMASNPKQTSNSRVTIKIPMPDDYFKDEDYENSQELTADSIESEKNSTNFSMIRDMDFVCPETPRVIGASNHDYPSSMYYRNGIIESVVNVHGVAKTIIEEDSESDIDLDDSSGNESGRNSFKLHRGSTGSSRSSVLSYIRRTSSMSSSSSSRSSSRASSIGRVSAAADNPSCNTHSDDEDEVINICVENLDTQHLLSSSSRHSCL